jgi:hypothetical protein
MTSKPADTVSIWRDASVSARHRTRPQVRRHLKQSCCMYGQLAPPWCQLPLHLERSEALTTTMKVCYALWVVGPGGACELQRVDAACTAHHTPRLPDPCASGSLPFGGGRTARGRARPTVHIDCHTTTPPTWPCTVPLGTQKCRPLPADGP